MCKWQGIILETRLNIHLSRCENPDSQNRYTPATEEVCNLCPNRVKIDGPDELAESMAEVFNAEVSEHSAEILANLEAHYCADCVQKQEV
jgi:hypothetical protein